MSLGTLLLAACHKDRDKNKLELSSQINAERFEWVRNSPETFRLRTVILLLTTNSVCLLLAVINKPPSDEKIPTVSVFIKSCSIETRSHASEHTKQMELFGLTLLKIDAFVSQSASHAVKAVTVAYWVRSGYWPI